MLYPHYISAKLQASVRQSCSTSKFQLQIVDGIACTLGDRRFFFPVCGERKLDLSENGEPLEPWFTKSLVDGFNPSEKYQSIGMMNFPTNMEK